MTNEFRTQVESVMEQWRTDLEKSKEQEEKLHNLFKQQTKMFQRLRVVQSQRMNSLKHLHEQYLKVMFALGIMPEWAYCKRYLQSICYHLHYCVVDLSTVICKKTYYSLFSCVCVQNEK